MRAWMLPWLVPLGLLVTVALVSLFPSLPASLLPVVWGFLVFPVGLICYRSRDRSTGRKLDETDTDYWRTKPS